MMTTEEIFQELEQEIKKRQSKQERAAHKLAAQLRTRYTMLRDADTVGPVWESIFANEKAWLDQISVRPAGDYSNDPKAWIVAWETDIDWCSEVWTHVDGIEYEPYYSFLMVLS